TSTSAASPSVSHCAVSARNAASSSALTINSAASAPSAAASRSWYSVTMKSLRRSGTPTAARTAVRCSDAPSKNVGSVRTEIAAAGVRSRVACRVVVAAKDAARRRAAFALRDDARRGGAREGLDEPVATRTTAAALELGLVASTASDVHAAAGRGDYRAEKIRV